MIFDRYVNKFISFLCEKKESFDGAVLRIFPKLVSVFVKKKDSKLNLDVKRTLLPVFYAAIRPGFSVSQAVEYLREKGFETHSAKYILDKLKCVNFDLMQKMFDSCREIIFKTLLKFGFKKRKCLVAIDYHDKPFYGNKKTKGTVGCKRKAGTNTAYRYITACIAEEGIRFNLACIPVTQLDNEQELLKEIITLSKKYVEIGCLLLDRGFNSVENYKLLEEELKLKYIMPQQKNSKLKKMLKKDNLETYSQFEYTFYEDRAKEYQYTVTMFYILNEKEEKYTFTTNIKTTSKKLLDIIVQCYDKRWGIETGYRTETNFLSKTTTKSFKLRTLFTQLSFLLQDLWTLKNYTLHKTTKTHEPREKNITKSKTLYQFLKAASTKLKHTWKPKNKALIFSDQICDTIKNKLNKKTPT